MIYWGITCSSHDGALAVYKDGEIVFASESERFSRVKNDPEISYKLIQHVEDAYGKPDKVFYYENPYIKATRRWSVRQKPYLKKPNFPYKVKYSLHHESHAAYGYYTSPFDDCIVLVIDAIGEWDTLTVWKAKGKKLKKLWGWKYPKSLGLMYSALTQYSGWKPNEEEYIMMGAAARQIEPYEPAYKRIKNLWDEEVSWHKGCLNIDEWKRYPEIRPEDVPTAAQKVYDEVFNDILNKVTLMPENETNNLVFAGGCALNVSANRQLSRFSNVYIPCNPGDSGSATVSYTHLTLPTKA